MDISIFIFLLFHFCCLALLTFQFGICSSEIVCIPSEREALLRFKHHLQDPSNRLSSWNSSNSNCCHWTGVVCSHVTASVLQLHLNTSPPSEDDFFSIDEYDKAYDEYLSQRFGGVISASLVELKHLNHLDLSGNHFGGTLQIPTFLGEMTSLTYLNLSDTGFNGNIPHQIGNLSNLLFLDLGNANLSKSFDWLQTLQALPSLVELRLEGCTFPIHYNQPSSLNFSSLATLDFSEIYSVVPKWIFGLRKLVSLQLHHNDIQGPMPDGIQNLTLLENLDLSLNPLSSSIPDWLYRLRHLKFLNLNANNLHGNISDAMGNLTSLVKLYLSDNQLEGKIPTSLGDLTSLVELDLSINQLEGKIPTSLGDLTSLVKLDLSDNQLEGRIPTSLGNLCNLREIGFSSLKLNQQVNEILEILTPCVSHGITELFMGSSQLSGNLTDQIGLFKNIEVLDLSNNSIHGALPSSFGKLSSLRSLYLSENQFNGNPFEVLQSLSELSYLSIGDNLFQGVVKEDDLANLKSLKWLYAPGNNLTLEVGPSWHPSFQLQGLSMSSWQLGPNFPSWIQSQKDISNLDMSNTGISDSIPPWFWETFSYDAFVLNLSHNHIHGELANTLANPISIRSVDLSSNHIRGKLPHFFGNYVSWLDLSNNSFFDSMTDFLCQKQDSPMQLELLNLASNNLFGEIPDCWRVWTNLVDVNLQSNRFVGNMPPSMDSLTRLQSLYVRNNSLSGIFPTFLNKTNELICLDLGENNFTGIIPAWVGERLLDLKILRLRSNRFLGHIPKEICDMNFLRDLDLAENRLSGNIPSCFNHLNAMLLRNRSTQSFIYLSGVTSYQRGYSTVSLLLWTKGISREYTNILGLVTNVDLSHNNLSGDIPQEITNLDGLIYLNLSMNQLSGQIPPSIGNMRSLESIDFSRNQLSGEIPSTISNLSFLSKLDLSYNHLKGKIPTATQLQSFEASNFVGNNLCGPPLPVNCSSHGQVPNDDHNVKESDRHGVNWFFVSMAFGFVVGFWAVVAPLFIFRSWRHTYYRFLDDMWYKVQSCW